VEEAVLAQAGQLITDEKQEHSKGTQPEDDVANLKDLIDSV
jgi:hypothetical protein